MSSFYAAVWRGLFSIWVAVLFMAEAKGITVSGRVTESDLAPVPGATIAVLQVGGELPLFTTQTGSDGRWSVSDPLLTGNIRVTPSLASFTFSPASRDSFTFADLPNQDFIATPTTPRANLNVLSGVEVPILSGGSFPLPLLALGETNVPAFILRNDGTLPLHNISITITGAHSAEFSVSRAPAAVLSPGEFTVTTVRFAPAAAGVRTATLLIHSDDPNENPYLVQLSGTVVSLEVNNTADSGPGSLRQAMANAALTGSDDRIVLHPSLSGQAISLSNEIVITASGQITLDASDLPAGLTVSGRGVTRIFKVGRTAAVFVTGVSFVDGNSASVGLNASGGAISSEGSLFVTRCTFSNNVAPFQGGAIDHATDSGRLTVSNCFFTGNSALFGGALAWDGPANIAQSTFAMNSADAGGAVFASISATIVRGTFTGNSADEGGAISTVRTLTLNHCTIAGNTALVGGGVACRSGETVFCSFSILAGNQASVFSNVFGTMIAQGSVTNGLPLLAPLDDYGGSTKTMALLPGSPARDLAFLSASVTDQRGFPIVGFPDAGAYEAGTFSNFNAFVWESLPASATPAQHAAAFDFDGDGASNLAEWIALTNPADPSSTFRITDFFVGTSAARVTFSASPERRYSLETSTNLIDWTPQPRTIGATSNSITVPVPSPGAPPNLFLRVRVIP